MARHVVAVLALAAPLALGACASYPQPYAYSPYEAGVPAAVEEGTIVSARPVTFKGQEQGSGPAIGGLAGAAIGSQFGGDAGGALLGAVMGGALGAAAGASIEQGNVRQGFAYTIRRERDGSMFEVAQIEPQPIPPGTRVHVTYGDRVRIVPADGYGGYGAAPGYPPPQGYPGAPGYSGAPGYPPPPPPPPPRYGY